MPEDMPDLLSMWQELRALAGRGDRAVPPASPEAVLGRISEAQSSPGVRIVVATVGEDIAGMAVLTHSPFAALFDYHAAHVHYLHVRQTWRRRGVGRALLTAAAAFAEEHGAEHVVTAVHPALRDANRFYARLGFAPMVVRRVATVSMLRRKLAADPRVGALEEVLHRRRSLRMRARLGAQALASTAD